MAETVINGNRFYNEDCIRGARKHIQDSSIDLIITDPPYGIQGHTLQKHYHRKGDFVVDGYIEVPKEEYSEFSRKWIKEAERILRPGGSIYVLSGYTNLVDILNALGETSLEEVNHIIWRYNFGVYTKNKYVSSHYHILYYVKPGRRPTFNTFCRYGPDERDGEGRSLNYRDREDVWVINREYKPGKKKNVNELPAELLVKMMLYSSNEGDTVCDLFLGGFSTAKVAIGLNRTAVGFEKNKEVFEHNIKQIPSIEPGGLLKTLTEPKTGPPERQGKPWTKEEVASLYQRYEELYPRLGNKKDTIEVLCSEFGRGRFAIMNKLDART